MKEYTKVITLPLRKTLGLRRLWRRLQRWCTRFPSTTHYSKGGVWVLEGKRGVNGW